MLPDKSALVGGGLRMASSVFWNFYALAQLIQDRLPNYNTDWNNFCDFCDITDEKCAAAEQPSISDPSADIQAIHE